ncbi:MAG: TAXI family TRAP transporter solute-binding subunit [Alphaproteobacteria bacterium]|nr:TAXI family TRAP transporter solute-binding subunit [Alphaproteobacteria bacterium]
MSQRLAALIALLAFVALVVAALVTGGKLGLGDAGPIRISFQIATGSTDGVYFPVGQAMAGVISHPLGVGRCDTATVCGPAGVILSARTSQGAVDNLRAVNSGAVDSGLADGDVIAAAVAGRGAFRRPARHLRVIAALFFEEAHLVVAAKSSIQSVSDLRGQRVLLGPPGSGGVVRSRAILSAYRVRVREIISDDNAGQMMRDGKIDAYFTVAGVPLDSVRSLLADHVARLVPIDGEGRDRLIQVVPQLARAVIPVGAYPGNGGAVETVATRAYWVTRDSAPDPLIYGMVRALFNPANQSALAASHPSARSIGLDNAAANPGAALHPGASRFYREKGVLPGRAG